MDPRVTAVINRNGGVIARAEALDLGMSPGEIRAQVESGRWVRLRRGVYAPAETWTSLDEYVGRPLLRARAAVAQMRRGWVLSHDSAAHALGLPILRPKDPLVHVTRPGWTNAWTENGIKHHLAGFRDQQVQVVDGLRVLDLARTAVDIAREHGLDAGVVACDGAMRMGIRRAEMVAAYEPMEHWTGVPAARTSVRLADPGAQTPIESLGRLLVEEAGIGSPETQFPLWTPMGLVWCDMRVGNQIIETDGGLKYLSIAAGGVADRPVKEIVMDEKKRERLIKDEGLGVTRLFWEDHWGRRRAEAIARLRADAADARARYGDELPERLARQAAQIRAEYGVRRQGGA
jgi:hypothetical protein